MLADARAPRDPPPGENHYRGVLRKPGSAIAIGARAGFTGSCETA